MKLRNAILPLLLLVAFCGERPVVPLGPRTKATISNPTRVRAYRILNSSDSNYAAAQKTKPLFAEEYPILAEAVVSPAIAKKFADRLLDPDTYGHNDSAMCFHPGHALRFERGADSVDVVICFKCENLDIRPASAMNEPFVSSLPIGHIAEPLYDAMREIFPEKGR